MKVEYIICFDDRTWETEVFDIPADETADEYLVRSLWGATVYRKAAYIGVYNDCLEEEP